MPKGRHIHSAKFRRCVRKVAAKSKGMYNPYAVCSSSIGYEGSITKEHKRHHSKRKMPRAAIEKMLKSPKTPIQLKKYWAKRLKKVV